mmetsp:Transcript_5884/g.14467  ORF Transcript_5884/g.14467 Transcript_5884/m.14467 type:complete len:164 (+) Transcript_5884:665-1156(+)
MCNVLFVGGAIISARTHNSKKHDFESGFAFFSFGKMDMHMKIYMYVHMFLSGRCDMDANIITDAASTTSTIHSKSCHYRRSFRPIDLDLDDDDGSRGLQKGESVALDVVEVDRRIPRAGPMKMMTERPPPFLLVVVLLPSSDRRTSRACRYGRRRHARSDTTD